MLRSVYREIFEGENLHEFRNFSPRNFSLVPRPGGSGGVVVSFPGQVEVVVGSGDETRPYG